jgi:hypothetical protein
MEWILPCHTAVRASSRTLIPGSSASFLQLRMNSSPNTFASSSPFSLAMIELPSMAIALLRRISSPGLAPAVVISRFFSTSPSIASRFIADVMLGKLATWLRFPGGCVGYLPPERMSRCPAGPQEEVVFQERQ